jgi:transcription termination factor NusB
LVHGGVPAPLAINGAVELAKVYSTERSYAFINAILDRIALSRAEHQAPGDRVT